MLLYKDRNINFQRLRRQKTQNWNDFLMHEYSNGIFDPFWSDIDGFLWRRLWIGACRGGEEGAANFDELVKKK